VTVVHTDEQILVIDKPSGVPSVPLSREPQARETAVHLALKIHPELESVGREVGRPLESGLIHRLDTGTSGLLTFARDAETYARLRGLWKSPSVRKTYRALVSGEPPFPKLPLVINVPIGRSAKSGKRMLLALPGRENQLRGKPLPAHTEILKQQRIEFGACLRQLYDLEVTIRTGVMHQIRCHLAAQGWPVLGDKIYHGDSSERLWLHAWKLSLARPDGSVLEITAPLPSGWPPSSATAHGVSAV
jgi:23S rRNA-/tRNA-specific pseudouridylate synthase